MVVEFKLTANTAALERKLNNAVNSQIPYATSLALNETAKTMLAKNRQDMKLAFNNPTPFTLNAFYIQWASKNKPRAVIRRKEMVVGRHYLEVQDAGGPRGYKGFEKKAQTKIAWQGYIGAVTPTRAAPTNKSGKMSQGWLRKVETEVKFSADVAARINERKPGRKKTGYFIAAPTHPLGQGKRSGIYYRNAVGNAKKMLNFPQGGMPTYRRRTNFDANMRKYFQLEYGPQFNVALRKALSTMKLYR